MSERELQEPAEKDAYTPEADDPDHEFSEAAGYAGWEPSPRPWLRWLIVGMSLLLALSLALPLLLRLL